MSAARWQSFAFMCGSEWVNLTFIFHIITERVSEQSDKSSNWKTFFCISSGDVFDLTFSKLYCLCIVWKLLQVFYINKKKKKATGTYFICYEKKTSEQVSNNTASSRKLCLSHVQACLVSQVTTQTQTLDHFSASDYLPRAPFTLESCWNLLYCNTHLAQIINTFHHIGINGWWRYCG